jgi:hypothetical protein
MHKQFVENLIAKVKTDTSIAGLAIGGSWITNQMDEFSDLDLIVITDELVSDDFNKMYNYAKGFGILLNAFTGEHVGERRLLICMYDNPLIHVDIKFILPEDLKHRVEDPVILYDRNGCIENIIKSTTSAWPPLDYQWIEDRFWTWIHYAALKLGRGEYFEALDFISSLRIMVLSPLLQIKNRQLPRGLRKVEKYFSKTELKKLEETVPVYSPNSITFSLEKAIEMYRELRSELFPDTVIRRKETEKRCVEYFLEIKKRIIK